MLFHWIGKWFGANALGYALIVIGALGGLFHLGLLFDKRKGSSFGYLLLAGLMVFFGYNVSCDSRPSSSALVAPTAVTAAAPPVPPVETPHQLYVKKTRALLNLLIPLESPVYFFGMDLNEFQRILALVDAESEACKDMLTWDDRANPSYAAVCEALTGLRASRDGLVKASRPFPAQEYDLKYPYRLPGSQSEMRYLGAHSDWMEKRDEASHRALERWKQAAKAIGEARRLIAEGK